MHRPLGTLVRAALAALALAVAATPPATATQPTPFKITNIHFETNASACDMGIQLSFDTDGITEGEVESPDGRVVFSLGTTPGMETTNDLTEQFQERVEPPISDLIAALGCEPSEEAISLAELFDAWPEGWYEFEGESADQEFAGRARLTHRIPAGPRILTPADGAIVPHDARLLIRWRRVSKPLLPELGPVEIVGYHVVVADVTEPMLAPGKTKTLLDADLARTETSFPVPKQFLEPNRIYEFEVLATEKNGNQTITEGGVFCTPPITAEDCAAP